MPYANPWVLPLLEGNPWTLPPLPEGYDPPPWRPHLPKLTLRQINALLNLALACCVIFLTLVFPVLLYQGVTGSDAVLGWRFVVVSSGSMEPEICDGALLLAKETPFRRLEEGDIIVYDCGGRLNTHRIIALEYGTAITKGDAALLPDSVPVTPEMYRCEVRKVYNGFAWVTKALAE
ncbi:MAG: signal peptidase I [Firmicutes bacterium]|nr:signal peptidase I [Bacillota bacterium]